MSNAVCAPASRVFSYERVSSTKQGQGSGLQRQSASAAAWCEAQGLVLDQELSLIDSGRSAFKGDHLHGALGRFLALAQAGELGTDPILLVEALDRLSRQEALDALDTILQGLIRSGVRIITLEDGAEYSRRTLRDDASRLIVLVVKVQAAYEYSRRLAMRITDTWNRTRERLRDGVIDRPAIFRPAWCDWDGAQFTLNSYAAVIREALALLRDHGSNAVARMLNEQGTTSPGGKAWTRAGVELLLKDPRIWGTVALNNPRRARKLRDKGITPPPQELLPGLLPPLTTQAAIEEVLALRAQRASHTGLRGPNTQLYWVGQGITTCTCGATCGTVSARTPRKELGGVLRYMMCRHRLSHADGCRGRRYPLPALTAHLLTRLGRGDLNQMLEAHDGRDRQAAAAAAKVQQLMGAVAVAEQRQGNAERALKDAALSGDLQPIVAAAVQEARQEVARQREALAAARAELAVLGSQQGTEGLDDAVATMLRAFADRSDTAEVRRAVNTGLRRLQVQVLLDPDSPRVGIRIGDGEVDWQPLHGSLAISLLQEGASGALYATVAITASEVEKAMATLRESGGDAVPVPVEVLEGRLLGSSRRAGLRAAGELA